MCDTVKTRSKIKHSPPFGVKINMPWADLSILRNEQLVQSRTRRRLRGSRCTKTNDRMQGWYYEKKWFGNACFRAQLSSKYGTWYSERVIWQIWCAFSETAVHCYDLALSVLGMLHGVSKRFSRSISHAVYRLYPTLAAFIVCGPFSVSSFSFGMYAFVGDCAGISFGMIEQTELNLNLALLA